VTWALLSNLNIFGMMPVLIFVVVTMHALQYSCFDHWFIIGVAPYDSLTDSDFTTVNRDRTRQSFIQ